MTTATKPAAITPAQRKALLLVAGGNVVAWLRGEAGFATINGNAERKLNDLGLIEDVKVMTRTRTAYGTAMTYDVKVWVLTPAGRNALGVVSSTTATANTRAHQVRAIGRQHVDDAAPMGECAVCETVGEWNALVDLAPNAYGCPGRARY
ncbi:hypothetical protein ACGF3G_00690 [Streptomyces sp. NPDC048179]|uniref:hypothetical protein n=1 Tax=Streptomyces sp. NPDC048179 TaxID=3365506 RepID=UPI00371A37DB